MARYYIVWVNRTVTDFYHPLFECAYAAELLGMLFFVVLSPVFYESVIRARVLHVNNRIMAILMHFHYFVSLLCRIVLIAYQHLNIPLRDDDVLLAVCVVLRRVEMPYISGSFGAIALERIIGTYFWKWYEQQRRGTLVVVIPILIYKYTAALAITAGLVFGVYSLTVAFLLEALLFGASLIFSFTVVFNIQAEVKRLKKFGASYSINRRFQIRENILMIKTLTALIRPVIIMTIAVYGMLGVYLIVPENFHFIHFFSIALYDVCIVIYANVLFILFISRQPTFAETARRSTMGRIMLNFLRRPKLPSSSVTPVENVPETDVYFKMFQKQIA